MGNVASYVICQKPKYQIVSVDIHHVISHSKSEELVDREFHRIRTVLDAQSDASLERPVVNNPWRKTVRVRRAECLFDTENDDTQVFSQFFDAVRQLDTEAWFSFPNLNQLYTPVDREQKKWTLVCKGLGSGTFQTCNKYLLCGEHSGDIEAHFIVTDHVKCKVYVGANHYIEWKGSQLSRQVTVHQLKDGTVELYFHALIPPKVFEEISLKDKGISRDRDEGQWSRRSSFLGFERHVVGQSDFWKLVLKPSWGRVPKAYDLLQALYHIGWDVRLANVVTESLKNVSQAPSANISFSALYQYKVFLSLGLKASTKMSPSTAKIIFAKKNEEDIIDLLKHFKEEVEKAKDKHFLLCFDDEAHRSSRSSSPNGRVLKQRSKILVRRVVLTPTRVIYQEPQYVESNRIFRDDRYSSEFALRVLFRDEDCAEKLNNVTYFRCGERELDAEILDACILQTLKHGLRVGNRVYRLLSGSQSMLAEHGCYLYSEDIKGQSAADIRASVGDFEHIHCVATYMSRLGLAFSQTTGGTEIYDSMIIQEDDVKGGKDPRGEPYCFSDGVGRISSTLLQQVLTKGQSSCAIQIRMGGIKGMLALDPKLGTRPLLVIRPSMKKFHSRHQKLEIQAVSRPKKLRLNRQVITLLEQLGIQEDVFFELLDDHLKQFFMGFIDDKYMKECLAWQGLRLKYERYERLGIKLTMQPFFRRCLISVFISHLEELMSKPKIPIPPQYGRSMFGVVDETGILDYGQVFVQYSKNTNDPQGKRVVLEGEVVVSKMPALHPGDVRKFHAVNVPALRHLYDVIVFPQRGKRPHPDEMAGSDLDGDEYFVTWHPKLVFQRENVPPMDFPSARKAEKKSEINEEDLLTHLKHYILSDKKGIISNAHLKQADYQSKGIFSDECLKIAQIFAQAVDAPKTGIMPYLPPELTAPADPDFMGSEGHTKTYRSERVLGKIYRYIKENKDLLSEQNSKPTKRISCPRTPHEHVAKHLYNIYETAMNNLMAKFKVDEFQILCKKIRRKKDDDATFQNNKREIEEEINNLKRKLSSELSSMSKGPRSVALSRDMLLACLYHTPDLSDRPRDTELYGMPWLLIDSLKSQPEKPEKTEFPVILFCSSMGHSLVAQLRVDSESRLLTVITDEAVSKGCQFADWHHGFHQCQSVVIVAECFLRCSGAKSIEDKIQIVNHVIGTGVELRYVDKSRRAEDVGVWQGIKSFFTGKDAHMVKTRSVVRHSLEGIQKKPFDRLEMLGQLVYSSLYGMTKMLRPVSLSDPVIIRRLRKAFCSLATLGTCDLATKPMNEQIRQEQKSITEGIVVDQKALDKHLADYGMNLLKFKEDVKNGLALQRFDIEKVPNSTSYKVELTGELDTISSIKSKFQEMNGSQLSLKKK